jgi:uncharacterized protein involved in exopolysaccharide biosynthesis
MALQSKSSEIDRLLAEIEPEILDSQRGLQEIETENDRLTRELNLAQETYVTLARKADEAHITTQERTGILQVGSYASVPREPVGAGRLINAAIAGLLGAAVAVCGAFLAAFLREDNPETQPTEE